MHGLFFECFVQRLFLPLQRYFNTMVTTPQKEKWYRKLRNKYRLVLFNETTFEERFSFRVNRVQVIVFLLSMAITFVAITFFVIAYTPLKEYIPGYPNIRQKKELYHLNRVADSLLADARQKDLYIQNIKRIIENKESTAPPKEPSLAPKNYDTIVDRLSPEDSALRVSFENQTRFNLFPENEDFSGNVQISSQNFFKPINGVITARFSPLEKHYGIDIVAPHNDAVKSVLDGTVIFSGWTLETGYVIAIQHAGNLISVYKHNAVLLKHEGDLVKAGEPVAIAGNSGEITTGPHLHFELWYNGNPVNPVNYINFN
jgi:murein DD-endopeptidase MepM/ murein hydrolase activator NlpD